MMQKKYKILVVDDSPLNIRILSSILKDDYRVQTALHGDKALQIIFGDDPPDLILLDIMMPGIDGYEVCRRIKADPGTAGIPVIFVTGRSDVEDEAYGLSLGAVDYITKPFHFPIIKARVKNHLELLQAKRSAQEAHSRLSKELQAMSDLQTSILPSTEYHSQGLYARGFYQPSGLAGGDYFDYLPLGHDGLRCVIADVSGHGARAAFLMSMVRTVFHFDEAVLPLPHLLEALNSQLMQTVGDMGDFVTLMAVDIDPLKNRLEYINAGHCPAFLRDGQSLHEIEPTAALLGFHQEKYKSRFLECGRDWELFMYTDGFYECRVNGKDIFGYEAFRELCFGLLSRDDFQVQDLAGRVSAASKGVVGFEDDLTGIYVQSKGK
ncbi:MULTISPECIES: SpoIIE family protein phosphatase [Desulfonatronospira]|nr:MULTISPECIES: SpoIIE family protein phosphatase [Desulfonatronospira]